MRRHLLLLAAAAALCAPTAARTQRAVHAHVASGSLGLVAAVYDQRLAPRVAAHAGLGYLLVLDLDLDRLEGRAAPAVPAGVSLLAGRGPHHLEGSAGVLLVAGPLTGDGGERWSQVLGTVAAGYRYQRAGGGLLLRVGAMPVVGGPRRELTGYLSLGYSFGGGGRRR